VYITGDDPAAAFESNNASLGYDRLAILNDNFLNFPQSAAKHFGKFANSSRPYIVWEPSDQATMLAMGRAYVDQDVVHPAGMRWAINTDPAQFVTFTAPLSEEAWGGPLLQGTSSVDAPVNASSAAIVVPPSWFAPPFEFSHQRLGVAAYVDSRGVKMCLWGFNTTGQAWRMLAEGVVVLDLSTDSGAMNPGSTVLRTDVTLLELANHSVVVLVDVQTTRVPSDRTELVVFVVDPAVGGSVSVVLHPEASGSQKLPAPSRWCST
jgi:hypothetical protein